MNAPGARRLDLRHDAHPSPRTTLPTSFPTSCFTRHSHMVIYGPVGLLQRLGLFGIAFGVAVQLGVPEGLVGLGAAGLAMWTTVPEAAMHEHRDLAAHEGNVGFAGRLGIVQPVAGEAAFAQHPSHRQLRSGVLRPDAAHGGADARILRHGGTAVAEVGLWGHVLKEPKPRPAL